MNVTFNNVTISIEADTAVAAYNRLCEILSNDEGDLEFTTNTYSIYNEQTKKNEEDRDTSELWPNPPFAMEDTQL